MPIYKKNNKYYAKVNYKDANGQYKSSQSRYFDTKKEAKAQEAVLLQNIGKFKDKNITFADAYAEIIELRKKKGVHQRTLAKLGNYYAAFGDFADLRVADIRQKHIDDLRTTLEATYQPSTIHMMLSFAKSTINYAAQKHHIACDYLDISASIEKKPKSKLNFYDLDEFSRFYDCLDDIVYKTLFDLLFYNGLRISEARGLTFADFDGSHITINKQYYKAQGLSHSLKTNNSYRTLPVNLRLVEELKELRVYYSSMPHFVENWYIFGGLTPISETSIRYAMKKAAEKAKVKQIRLHDFRHSCASYYIHQGFALNLVADLLGDNMNTVYNTYYHLYQKDLTNMINSAEIRG